VRKLALLAAAILVGVAAAGCSSGMPDKGPLGDGGDPGGICVPVPAGKVLSWGVTPLENKGTATAVIKSVRLVGASHVNLAATWVVPFTGNYEYPAAIGYPPAPRLPKSIRWDERMHVPGATVRASKMASLVTVLKPDGSAGTVHAIAVTYREGGGTFLFRTHYVIKLRGKC
jgi:hypothetical protein